MTGQGLPRVRTTAIRPWPRQIATHTECRNVQLPDFGFVKIDIACALHPRFSRALHVHREIK